MFRGHSRSDRRSGKPDRPGARHDGKVGHGQLLTTGAGRTLTAGVAYEVFQVR
jgi:hypothetical protein